MKTNQTYGQALEALKQGKRVSRIGWNGKNMFVFMRPGDVLDAGFIGKVRSLPESVKTFLATLDRDIAFLPPVYVGGHWRGGQRLVSLTDRHAG